MPLIAQGEPPVFALRVPFNSNASSRTMKSLFTCKEIVGRIHRSFCSSSLRWCSGWFDWLKGLRKAVKTYASRLNPPQQLSALPGRGGTAVVSEPALSPHRDIAVFDRHVGGTCGV